MEYLVMECGLSYAVVLDSEGRFLKVPNLGYEVGQTLNSVVLQDAPLPAPSAAKAACPLGSYGSLPLYHGHWKLELLAVAGGNGAHADQPRRADERQPF